MLSTKFVLAISATTTVSAYSATEIWAPMWDIRDTPMTWEIKAEGTTLTANSFNVDAATFRVTTLDGSVTLATVSGTGDVSSGPLAVTPGEVYKVVFDSGFHSRPSWIGVEWARLGPGTQAAGPAPGAVGFQSDAELGFDERWGHLPSQFADTAWSFNVAAGEHLSVSVEHMTGNIHGTGEFEFISPSGVATTVDPDGLPGSGGAHFSARGGSLALPPDPTSAFWDEYAAPISESGWWQFKLNAAPGIGEPYSWHYVLDRTDSGADQYVYLRPGAILPPPLPESIHSMGALALGIAGLAWTCRRNVGSEGKATCAARG